MKKYILIVLISLLCLGVYRCGYEYLVVDACYDLGGVWDNKQCRYDCLTISKVNGCIKMTESQVAYFKEHKKLADNM